jgi:hypothetical protein
VTGHIAAPRHVVRVQGLLFRTKDTGAQRPGSATAMKALEAESESRKSDDISHKDASFKGMAPVEYTT